SIYDLAHHAKADEGEAADDFETQYCSANWPCRDSAWREGVRCFRRCLVRCLPLCRCGADPWLDWSLFQPMDQTHEFLTFWRSSVGIPGAAHSSLAVNRAMGKLSATC